MAISFLGLPAILFALLAIAASAQAQAVSSGATSAAPSGKVWGRVINAVTGVPVPRGLVHFNSWAMLTDHEGQFHFEPVTESAGNLQVTKPGFSMSPDPSEGANQFVQLDQASFPIELRVYPEAVLTGTVTDAGGEPIAHVSVIARRSSFDDSAGHRWVITGQGQTDSHGDFRITVSAGDYKLETRYLPRNGGIAEAVLPVSVPLPSETSDAQAIHVRSGEEPHFDLHPAVRRTYPVPVTLEAGPDRGFPMVTAHGSDGTTFNVPMVPSRGGQHAALNLPMGSYLLSARLQSQEDMETAEAQVTVTSGDNTPGVVLRFASTPSIPIDMSIESAAASDNASQSSSGMAGFSSISGPGQNTLTPMQFGLSLVRFDSSPDEDAASFSVMTPRGGSPVISAPPGTYRLTAHYGGGWHIRSASSGTTDLLTEPLVVAAGTSSTPIRIQVTNQTGTIQGSVNLKGIAASSCWVYLISVTPSLTPVMNARCGNNGRLMSPPLPPGSYEAIAFEHRHPANYKDPATLAKFSTYVQSVTISAGGQSTVNLNAVPQAEVQP